MVSWLRYRHSFSRVESILTPRQLAVISGAQLLPRMAAPSLKLIVCADASDGAASATTTMIDLPQTMAISQPMNQPMVKGFGEQKAVLSYCLCSYIAPFGKPVCRPCDSGPIVKLP